MRYVLKEMTIGEVLDVGVNIAKDNFKPLFMITLYLVLPVNLITHLLMISIIPDPPGMFAPLAEHEAFQQTMVKNFLANGPILICLAAALFVVIPVTYAAMIRAIAGTYLGQQMTAGQAIKAGLWVVVPYVIVHTIILVILFLCVFLGTLIGALTGSIPLAVLCFFLSLVPAAYFSVRLFLAPYCVIIEGASIGSAFSRSWHLMRGNILNGFVLGFIVTMAAIMTNGMASAIPQRHIAGVLGAIIGAGILVGTCATAVVFYFSCRCKHENFDLSVLASGVGLEMPPNEISDSGGPGVAGGPGELSGPSTRAQG